jgi:hypothetical protein
VTSKWFVAVSTKGMAIYFFLCRKTLRLDICTFFVKDNPIFVL